MSDPRERYYCEYCHCLSGRIHDHATDLSGLDDGPWLRGHAPRKKSAIENVSGIRKQAWATRRKKYGEAGHR
jgi:hypothetical protein